MMSDRFKETDLVRPDWPAPGNIRAFSTTRRGGVSRGPWASLNLGPNCGDEPANVLENRRRIARLLPAEPLWMEQVHGARVLESGEDGTGHEQADARVESAPGRVVTIMSADCLPVLLCDEDGARIGAAHAGWRGIAAGVIEATVERMEASPGRLMAWLGPAISGAVYEVGDDVRDAFAAAEGHARRSVDGSFTRHGGRWLLDVAGAARRILEALGVQRVYGGGFCTYREPDRFFSHRRDGATGRMASVIWLEDH